MIEFEDLPFNVIADIKVLSVEYILETMEPYLVVNPMDVNLDQITLRAGRAFGQCQRLYISEARALEKFITRKNQLELHLRRYYTGQANPEVYRTRPLKASILKTEVDMWLKADEAYIELCEFVEEQRRKVKLLEQMFDRIKSMGYEVKNAIEWRKYMSGD